MNRIRANIPEEDRKSMAVLGGTENQANPLQASSSSGEDDGSALGALRAGKKNPASQSTPVGGTIAFGSSPEEYNGGETIHPEGIGAHSSAGKTNQSSGLNTQDDAFLTELGIRGEYDGIVKDLDDIRK